MANILNQFEISGVTYDLQDAEARQLINGKQDTLVSGTNIKTINNESLLGSGNITIEGGTTDAYTKAETDALLAEKADTSAMTADINAAVSGKADTSAVTSAIEAAVSGKADADDVYTKSQVSSATEVADALALKQDASGMSAYTTDAELTAYTYDKQTIDDKIAQSGTFDPTLYYTTAQTSSSTQISTALADKADTSDIPSLDGYFNGAEYDSGTTRINFKHGNTVVTYIDASDFIKDGMVDNVQISGGNLVITFNVDAGKETITIPLTDIFDPSNYYTTAQTESAITSAVSGKAEQSDLSTLSGTVTAHTADTTIHVTSADKTAWNAKSDFSGSYNDLTDKPTIPTVPTSNTAFTNDAGYITSADLADYAQTSAVTEAIDAATSGKADTSAVTAAIDAAVSGKANSSDVYTTAQTSSSTEISTALSAKQDTLVSGTNIKTINNESLLGSGNITIQGGSGANVVELTQAQYDALVTKDQDTFYIITDAEEIDASSFYTSAQTESAITAAVSGKADTSAVTAAIDAAVSGKANSSDVYTTAQTSSSTEVSTALSSKQDTLTAGDSISISSNVISVTVDSALSSTSENPVQNKVIYAAIGDIETLLAAL